MRFKQVLLLESNVIKIERYARKSVHDGYEARIEKSATRVYLCGITQQSASIMILSVTVTRFFSPNLTLMKDTRSNHKKIWELVASGIKISGNQA